MIREIAQHGILNGSPEASSFWPARGTLQRTVLNYLFAIVALGIATSIRLMLSPYLGSHIPFSCNYVAIIFIAWFGGLGPAAFATICGLLLSEYLFVPPFAQVVPVGVENWVALFAYLAVSCSVILLTERLRHEQEKLAKANADTREIIENVSEAIIAFDENWRFRFLNRTAESMFGLKAERLLGKCIWDVAPEAKSSPHYQQFQTVMTGRKPFRTEDFHEQSGEWYWLEIMPLESGGITVRYINITDEVRERQSIQRKLQALESVQNLADGKIGNPNTSETEKELFSPWY